MRVLIVGGGIGGLTLAIALRRQGLRPEIVERFRRTFAEFRGAVPDVLAQLTRAEQLIHNDLEEVRQSPWYRGRIVLLGDAAHAATPNMGQGAAMAIEDAASLARAGAGNSSSRTQPFAPSRAHRLRARIEGRAAVVTPSLDTPPEKTAATRDERGGTAARGPASFVAPCAQTRKS